MDRLKNQCVMCGTPTEQKFCSRECQERYTKVYNQIKTQILKHFKK